MTYEQGGGPAGGAAVLTQEGDTLTLSDRVQHHFTTSISTLEVASQNAAKLVTEFQKFYSNATKNGAGVHKSFVIKHADKDAQRMMALQTLLTKNEIKWGIGKSGSYRGYNYDTGKEETFAIGEKDMVIPGVQSKANLVTVLFEPNTVVVDSNTYDITAWALPYAYGLKGYASKERIGISAPAAISNTVQADATTSGSIYGYVIPWAGINSVKLVSQLLQRGIKIRVSSEPFESGGKNFDRGSVIILKTSNQYYANVWKEVNELAGKYGVPVTRVNSGFVDKGADFGSSKVQPLKKRRIALFTGEGISSNAAGEVWHYFDQLVEYPVTLINLADFSRTRWSDYDLIIMPDGNYRFLTDKAAADVFRNWISGGGNVIALEGAVAQLAKLDWAIKSKKSEDSSKSRNDYEALRKFENRERDFIPTVTPGSIFKVELDNTHPLAFGFPDYYYTLKQDDAIYEFIKEGGWNVGVLKKNRQVAGFVGSKLINKLQDGLLFGAQEIGRGNITYLADNVLFRSFWENGKLMFSNAVFLVGQ
jgi:hypothetical protein